MARCGRLESFIANAIFVCIGMDFYFDDGDYNSKVWYTFKIEIFTIRQYISSFKFLRLVDLVILCEQMPIPIAFLLSFIWHKIAKQ